MTSEVGTGMSRVFAAVESALDRGVVIKVLSRGLAAGLSSRRFAREIRLAVSLQQANIVPVLSAGEVQGMPAAHRIIGRVGLDDRIFTATGGGRPP